MLKQVTIYAVSLSFPNGEGFSFIFTKAPHTLDVRSLLKSHLHQTDDPHAVNALQNALKVMFSDEVEVESAHGESESQYSYVFAGTEVLLIQVNALPAFVPNQCDPNLN